MWALAIRQPNLDGCSASLLTAKAYENPANGIKQNVEYGFWKLWIQTAASLDLIKALPQADVRRLSDPLCYHRRVQCSATLNRNASYFQASLAGTGREQVPQKLKIPMQQRQILEAR
ncbi:MAG: hypothetical protein JWQ87_5031 [Candidatus Sulfotelmatobacter sp.]|nr:hypothetical protein [Candidatus Sulfotelmatobacter sp.]